MVEAGLLFRNYYRPLCLYALHYLNDVEQAEDAVQDCFVRLLVQAVKPQNARAWLYAAVRNRCIDLLRRKHPMIGDATADAYLDGLSDEEAQERSVDEAALWEAVDQLPARQREVLLMAKRDGHTYAEIADRLGISVKTVEHLLSRALKKLRGHKNSFFLTFLL